MLPFPVRAAFRFPRVRILAILALATVAQALELGPGSPELNVSGLGWHTEEAPILRRLPRRLQGTFRAPVWDLAQHPSGGRFRFRTDSARLTLSAANPDTSTMHHMTTVGQSGFDLYVDGLYRGSAWPDAQGRIRKEWTLGPAGRLREITLYLPLYKPVTLERIVLDDGAHAAAPTPFVRPGPVVYYGSSITQGGCAENPGLSYPAILGRRLGMDFVNLGFSGNGLGEPAVAEAVAELDAAAFVLDHWANPSPEVYRDTLPGFVDILRRHHPKTPILVVGPFWLPSENGSEEARDSQERKRSIGRSFVETRRKAGDRNLVFVDGRDMISREQASGYVDGVHPNSLGFAHCADGLEPHLRKVLRLGRRRDMDTGR